MSHRERTEPACFILWHFIIVVLLMGLFGSDPVSAAILDTANVMAPLQLKDENEWATFESQLATVKNYGVDAVSVDVWWGTAEGAGGVDKFRIKIWDKSTDTVVYDNMLGASDTADPATEIGGGSIVIHK